jgi:hypothetical protein
MKNLAAIFLFGVALVALCASFGGSRRAAKQVQFSPQVMRVSNSLADGNYIPVANDRSHPLFVVAMNDLPATWAYKVVPFSAPTVEGVNGAPPTVDETKLALSLDSLLNGQGDWEPVSIPPRFAPGVNLLVFRHRR